MTITRTLQRAYTKRVHGKDYFNSVRRHRKLQELARAEAREKARLARKQDKSLDEAEKEKALGFFGKAMKKLRDWKDAIRNK